MLSWLAPALLSAGPQAAPDPASALARPSAVQLEWADLELGMFVHLAPQTWQDRESDDLSTSPAEIDPALLDTEQWADVAASMGARYVVFVAKHEGGFCWWPTDTTDFGVKSSPWRGGKGDVLADLSRSCAKRGLALGVYLSPQDRKHGVGVGGKATSPEHQREYEQFFRLQLEEVLSRYGEMREVWFDGSLVFDVGDLLARHAPRAVVFQGPQATIRWVGNEDGVAPDPAWNAVHFGEKKWGDYTAADGDPAGDRWLPNECDARMRSTWFWNSRNEATLKSVDQLMEMYERSVGHGAVLLLNATPDRSGRIPDADAKRAAEFGAEIRRRYGSPLVETAGSSRRFELRPLDAPRPVDAVVTQERIEEGERVRRYSIEGLVDGEWVELARGTAIGHEKIDRFPLTEVEAVRFTVLESVGEPRLRRLALHDTSLPNRLAAAERAAGWKLLFDGESLAGWHGLGFVGVPEGLWVVRDGALEHVEKGAGPLQPDGQPLTGMDLASDGEYDDFELRFEWRVAEGGNSGVKYNVSEELSTSMAPPHAAKGWEYQLLDDEKAEDRAAASHRSGALYDLFAPAGKKRLEPAGRWNRSRIVRRGNRGEHWLNGSKVVEYELGSKEFEAAFAASKYRAYPAWFPERRKGRIVLQDHGDAVSFRSLAIRELK
jgi:alpha-L-fucosidase